MTEPLFFAPFNLSPICILTVQPSQNEKDRFHNKVCVTSQNGVGQDAKKAYFIFEWNIALISILPTFYYNFFNLFCLSSKQGGISHNGAH